MKIALSLLLLVLTTAPAWADSTKVFDRVVAKRELRCAYTIYPTFVEKDPNTGKFSGLFYDLMEEIGKQLEIKIVWAEEVGSDNIFEGLKTGRYDAVCTGYFGTPSRTFGGDFTQPVFYMPYYAYVRADEARFKKFEDLNSDKVTFSTLDGELSSVIQANRFPLSKAISLPGLTPATDRLEAVVSKKADVTMMEPSIAEEYMATHPNTLKQFTDQPLEVGGSVIIIPHHEHALKNMLDATIHSMTITNTLQPIIKKHQKFKGSFFAPAKPYEAVE